MLLALLFGHLKKARLKESRPLFSVVAMYSEPIFFTLVTNIIFSHRRGVVSSTKFKNLTRLALQLTRSLPQNMTNQELYLFLLLFRRDQCPDLLLHSTCCVGLFTVSNERRVAYGRHDAP